MARPRKSRPDGGDLKDSTKGMLVISFLLSTDNVQSSATMIWSAWDPKNPGTVGSVVSRKDRTLSLAGTIKVCTRLVSEGILVSITQKGYNKRDLVFYRFPSKEDQSYHDGFLRVAERTRGSPFLLMDSSYGRTGIKDVLMKKVETDLGISLEGWRSPAMWTIAHSPTAFVLACDKDLNSGEIRRTEAQDERMRGFLAAIHGAITVDRASGYRGRLLAERGQLTTRVMMLLAAGAQKAGSKDKDLQSLLEKVNEEIG